MFNFHKNPKSESQNVSEKYFDFVKERISKVKLFGKDEADNDILRELDQVFIELTIAEGYEKPFSTDVYRGMMDEELRRQRNFFLNENNSDKSFISTENKRLIKAKELLLEKTHAFVTGAPQCGKTTLLRYLAWQSYKEHDRLPVFLELKAIKGLDFSQTNINLLNFIFEKSIVGSLHLTDNQYRELRNYFYERLKLGEVSIFLDGLDEVKEESYFIDLCQLIEDFLQSDFRHNSLVVSARPFALHQTRIEGLKEVEILALNDNQINDFLSYYYDDNDLAANKLKQVISQQRHLREMARIPFLLAVMVDLLRKEQRLGNSRIDLYKAITLQLIRQLDKDKKVQRFAFQIEDPNGLIKISFLKYLAFEKLLENSESNDREVGRLIFTDKIIQEKAKKFVELEKLPNINYLELSGDIKATSLLREIGDDVFAFAHLTLQEYFAADVLASHPDCERIFCRTFFNTTLVEMEVLPMTLGISSRAAHLYKALEKLPESLILTNFRLRIRGLNYITDINQPEYKALLDEMATLLNPSGHMEGFRRSILRTLISLSDSAKQYLEDKMIPLLKEWSSISKTKAAEALRYIGSDKSIEPLLKALGLESSNDFFTSRSIGFSSFDDMLIDAASRALANINPNKAAQALALIRTSYSYGNIDRILREIGTEEAHKTLLKRRRQHLQWAATLVHDDLVTKSEHRSVKALLLESLGHQNSTVRGFVIETLGYLGFEETVEPLTKHLRDSDFSVRWKTANALGDIGSEKAVDSLLIALNDEFSDVRWCAASALWKIHSVKSVDGLIMALKDPNSEVVYHAVSALGYIGSDRAAEPLIQLLKFGSAKSRSAAAYAIGRLGGEFGVDTLIEYLNDPIDSVRTGCAYSLGKTGSEKAIIPLINALSDKSVEVKRGATYSLGLLKSEEAIPNLINLLQTNSDTRLKDWIVKSLGEIGTKECIVPLLAMSYSLFYSSDVAEAIAKIEPSLLEIELPELLNHENKYVRQRIVESIGYYSTNPNILNQLTEISQTDADDNIRKKAAEFKERYQNKLKIYDYFNTSETEGNLSSNESKDGILVGEVMRLVSLAGHIFRPTPNNDWGIDGEIEFKNNEGKATGDRVYVQLKSGESYLKHRQSDDKEIFYIKNLRHASYWRNQKYPVFLIIRKSDGVIRWMNVSEYIERHGTSITQIEFYGELFSSFNINLYYKKVSIS